MANFATKFFGRLVPESLASSDADRQALARQGLLALGAGLLGAKTGGNFGAALGQGLTSGLLAVNQGADNLADARYKNSLLANQAGGGSEFRSADAMARAAGYEPGSEEYKRAFRVALGVDPRASSAAIGYQKVKGPDGVERLVAVDPRAVGAQVIGDGTGYGSFSEPAGGPLDLAPGSAPASEPTPAQGFMDLAKQFPGITMTSGMRTPEHNRAVGGVPNSQHMSGTAADFVVPSNIKPAFFAAAKQLGYQPIEEGDHVHIQRAGGRSAARPNPFAGRRPEDEAAAVEDAKTRVQIANMPAKNALEAEGAAQKATAEAAAKREADLATAAQKKYVDAGTTLDLLDRAEDLIRKSTGSGAGATWDNVAATFGKSTPGAQAIAALDPIAASLTLAVPRMEGPQSDADRLLYQKAAGDFNNPRVPVQTRLAALKTMRALAEKYRNLGPGGAGLGGAATVKRRKFNPTTGKLEDAN